MTALEAYALAKKVAASAVSGIKSLTVNGTTLTIETNDGNTIDMVFPTPADGRGVASAAIDSNGHLILTYDDGTTQDAGVVPGADVEVEQILTSGTKIAEVEVNGRKTALYAPAGGSGGSSELSHDLDTTVKVGGIEAGENYATGTPLETILRDMLAPVLKPKLTDPSAVLTATGNTLLEKGSSISATLTVTFDRGSINPAYGTSGYRSGVATGYSLNGGSAQAGSTFNVNVNESAAHYQVSVSYDAGEQPKDSAGEDYSTPLPAGSVNSNAIDYEFVSALWANISNQSAITKLPLISKSEKEKVFNFPDCDIDNPETFDIPSDWTVLAIEVKNDFTGKYDDCTDEFTTSATVHGDASGSPVNYTRYSCNLGYDMAARDIKVKWA